MEFKEVIKNRYSCKKFSDKKIEKEKLCAILEAERERKRRPGDIP